MNMNCAIDLASPERLQRIRELAKKATPGPWEYFVCDGGICIGSQTPDEILFETPQEIPTKLTSREKGNNAAYIAAAHPGVILAMCEEIEGLREQVATHEVLSGEDDACMTQLEVERDALEEQVARLEKEADWLAREVSEWEHDQLDGTGNHIREVPELREAARKAVEKNDGH